MLIGAMTVVEMSNLITDDERSSDDDEDELLVGDIDANSPTINDDVDLDAIFIAGVNASRPGSTDAQHLAKVWHITMKMPKGCWMSHCSTVLENKIPCCLRTME